VGIGLVRFDCNDDDNDNDLADYILFRDGETLAYLNQVNVNERIYTYVDPNILERYNCYIKHI